MRIHWLQHVPFEGLGSIEDWADRRGHALARTRLFADEALPRADAFEWLVVMGGPMSVHDEAALPWLAPEKSLVRAAVAAGRRVLGICLGAQLLAEALGGAVTRNAHREIGWSPLRKAEALRGHPLDAALPDGIEAFHWHGETFSLPPGAVPVASSAACANQGFVHGPRVAALQFHLETTPKSAQALIAQCGSELVAGPYIQTAAAMLADPRRFERVNAAMGDVLDVLARG